MLNSTNNIGDRIVNRINSVNEFRDSLINGVTFDPDGRYYIRPLGGAIITEYGVSLYNHLPNEDRLTVDVDFPMLLRMVRATLIQDGYINGVYTFTFSCDKKGAELLRSLLPVQLTVLSVPKT